MKKMMKKEALNEDVKIVKVSYPYGNPKYFVEKKKTFLFFETWKREKEIIGGLCGTVESDKEFSNFISACDYVHIEMNVREFLYEEKSLTMNDLVW